jgi:hypothetical protein
VGNGVLSSPMSRGLGRLQLAIKQTILEAESYGLRGVTFADICRATAIRNDGSLRPTFKRSLKRAMQTLKMRGDVVIVHGSGGRWSPYVYATNFMRLR